MKSTNGCISRAALSYYVYLEYILRTVFIVHRRLCIILCSTLSASYVRSMVCRLQVSLRNMMLSCRNAAFAISLTAPICDARVCDLLVFGTVTQCNDGYNSSSSSSLTPSAQPRPKASSASSCQGGQRSRTKTKQTKHTLPLLLFHPPTVVGTPYPTIHS